jgi:hypothetical protein
VADDPTQQESIFASRSTKERSERCTALVDDAFSRLRRTRARQKLCRDFMLGRISANLPQAIKDAAIKHGDGHQVLEYHAPQSLMWPLKMVADFASQKPQPKRHPVARARESSAVANRIERIATGVMGELWAYRQSCDPMLLDAEAASIVVPATAHWAEATDQYDHVTAEEFAGLPEELRALWAPVPSRTGSSNGSTPGYRRYSRRYRRDREGRPEWDDAYQGRPERFREDTKQSAQAVDEELEERMRAKIPLQIDLLLPAQFAPINPRWEGDRLAVDGIARRETYGGVELYRRGYRWAKDGPALLPSDAMTSTSPVTLSTLLLQDGDGCPYLIYSVDGCRTWRSDAEADFSESIDLHDAYGFDFLPVVYQLGLHVMSATPDEWVIPYLLPLVTPSLHRDRLVAMNDFHVQQTACGGWFVKVDPQIRETMPELAQRPEWKIKQMTATPVPGDVTPAVHPGAGPGLVTQKEMLDQDILLAGPNAAALGGAGAQSGIDRALIGRDEDRGLSMAWDGLDALYAGTASNALRALACLARKHGEPITLNILTEMPDNDTSSSTKSTVVVDPDMFGGDYRVVAWRPEDWGSDPTRQAMIMDAQKNKQATWTEMREAVGDPDPVGTLAQIFVEDLVMNTPEGKAMVLEEAAKINADLKAMERSKLRRDKLLNQDDVPMGMAAGVAQPPDPNAGLLSEQGPVMPGVTLDVAAGAPGPINPASSSSTPSSGGPQAAACGSPTLAATCRGSTSDWGAEMPHGAQQAIQTRLAEHCTSTGRLRPPRRRPEAARAGERARFAGRAPTALLGG